LISKNKVKEIIKRVTRRIKKGKERKGKGPEESKGVEE